MTTATGRIYAAATARVISATGAATCPANAATSRLGTRSIKTTRAGIATQATLAGRVIASTTGAGHQYQGVVDVDTGTAATAAAATIYTCFAHHPVNNLPGDHIKYTGRACARAPCGGAVICGVATVGTRNRKRHLSIAGDRVTTGSQPTFSCY
ncbi:MAG: hypothetical protein KDI17_14920 [Halioglobus sp.]|nr:hypothetical protein [Halioglobus sp.]